MQRKCSLLFYKPTPRKWTVLGIETDFNAAAHDIFVAEIAEMSDRPTERSEAETQTGAKHVEPVSTLD
jgi:hypothetical protein